MHFLGRLAFVPAAAIILMASSCLKEEQPLVLPPAPASSAEAHTDRVDLGADYRAQVFYDLEGKHAAGTSEVTVWDLAFEASSTGDRVFINGGKDIAVCRTGSTSWNTTLSLPPGWTEKKWCYDAPSGHRDSTAIGQWRDVDSNKSKGEIYILRTGPGILRKVRLLSVDAECYKLEIGSAKSLAPEATLIVRKDPDQHFVYAQISGTGTQVTPDPPASAWDLVFTRYRHIYYDLDNTPYVVTGVLLPPSGVVSVAKDSVTAWEAVTAQTALGAGFSTARDAIGCFGWKAYNFGMQRYEVNAKMIYLIRSRNGKLYKLRFLDFYAPTGDKGSPAFEFVELK